MHVATAVGAVHATEVLIDRLQPASISMTVTDQVDADTLHGSRKAQQAGEREDEEVEGREEQGRPTGDGEGHLW